MADTKDRFSMTILNPKKFIDEEYSFRVEELFHSNLMTSQMSLSQESLDFSENAESLGSGMNGAVIGNFIVNTVLSGSLHYIWGMINCLQIDFHLVGMNNKMPATVWTLYSNLIAVT